MQFNYLFFAALLAGSGVAQPDVSGRHPLTLGLLLSSNMTDRSHSSRHQQRCQLQMAGNCTSLLYSQLFLTRPFASY